MERKKRETTPKDHVTVVEPGERPPQRPPPPERSSEGIVLAGGGTQHFFPEQLPQPVNVFYKTKLCVNYDSSGSCMFGADCAFAHGMAELRRPQVEDGKVCYNLMYKGICYYGENCIFSHASASAAPGLAIRNTEALPVTVRSETSSSSAPGRAFPPVPAPAVREEQEAGARGVSNLERLSRKNMRGIYGDWPEQY